MDQNLKNIEDELKEIEPVGLSQQLEDKLVSAMSHCVSSAELREVEIELVHLEPEELSEDQFEMLESAMELAGVEAELSQLAPIGMDSDLLERLEFAMNQTEYAEPKIVEFEQKAKPFDLRFLATAAAVAMAAVLSFMFIPSNKEDPATGYAEEEEVLDIVKPFNVSDPPKLNATVSSHIVNASNEGVMMDAGLPVRRLKVHYNEVQMIERNGKTYEVVKPMVKIVKLPLETD